MEQAPNYKFPLECEASLLVTYPIAYMVYNKTAGL